MAWDQCFEFHLLDHERIALLAKIDDLYTRFGRLNDSSKSICIERIGWVEL